MNLKSVLQLLLATLAPVLVDKASKAIDKIGKKKDAAPAA